VATQWHVERGSARVLGAARRERLGRTPPVQSTPGTGTQAVLQPPTRPAEIPYVSVVVPAYNACEWLTTCLEALFRQTYPRERYEIVIVDDGSQDGTADQAKALGNQWEGALSVIQRENGGPAQARNAGVRASSGEVIAFTDADCAASPDWLVEMVAALIQGDGAAAGGPIHNHAYGDWVSRFLTASQFYRHRGRHGRVDYLVTANLVIRRAALEAVGGFHDGAHTWSEDADLSFRLAKEGYSLLLAPRGCVTHFGSPQSIRSLSRELYRYGRGSYALHRRWPGTRRPARELARRAVATLLAPVLALRCARRVGFWRSLTFSPLVVVEHTSFAAGIIRGMIDHDG
jgi:mycofactocin glycosyltransferase